MKTKRLNYWIDRNKIKKSRLKSSIKRRETLLNLEKSELELVERRIEEYIKLLNNN